MANATNVGPVSASPGLPGGTSAALNLTAAQVVKASPGILFKLLVVAPGTGTTFTVNDSNALVTAQTVTAITAASAAVVTLSTGGATNPFAVGNTITFASVGGMTQINGLVGQVTAIGGVTTAWTVTVNINSTAFTAYTSGGTAASFGAANEIVTIAFGSLTVGESIPLEWPCGNGILVSAVPTGGSQFSISYS
jgi:hypothetical protein